MHIISDVVPVRPIAQPVQAAAPVNIVMRAAHAVYAHLLYMQNPDRKKQPRQRHLPLPVLRIKAPYRCNAKPSLKKGHVVPALRAVTGTVGNMEDKI
jgi:hypothetical protein